MNEEKFRIGISGSYGGMNMGDEAILESMVSQLRKSLPNLSITIFSRNPMDTIERHNVDRAVAVRKMTRQELAAEIKELDLFILGGGGLLFHTEARIYMREVVLAKELGVPVMVYAISVGPVHDSAEQDMIREGLNKVDVLTVRERAAKRLLEDWGVTKDIIVTADAALLLEPKEISREVVQREGLDDTKTVIGISVREPGPASDLGIESYYSYIANAADYMVERFDAHIVFVPMERHVLDLQHSHMVLSKMLNAEQASVLKGEYSPAQMLSIVKNFVFGVGMRLHFLIFLALAGVPFVALPYASKVEGFLESLQIELPPQYLNPGRLIAYIDKFWDHREDLKRQICTKLPNLQKKAAETNDLVVQSLLNQRRKETRAAVDKAA
ncbi:MAG: polysaccharide pyruvyl transferase family protein [Deltaproteobacteria bacterium]